MKNVKDSDFVQELTIIRIYDEPRELVFKAWTDPICWRFGGDPIIL